MSDAGPDDSLTSGDVWRYVWLGLLALMVLLAVVSQVEGGAVILLAVVLLGAVVVGLVVLQRSRRA